MMQTPRAFQRGLGLLIFSLACVASAAPKILSLVPPTEHSCLAVRIEVPQGQALSGLRWHHNDSTVSFPHLLLMEAQAGSSPDLSQTGLILEDLSGEELGWGEAILSEPVTSSTGSIHAVFVFPANLATTGTGNGTGPGLGVELNGTGPSFEVSPDGVQWISYLPEIRLVLEPVFAGSAKQGAMSLAELAERVEYVLPGQSARSHEEAPAITRNTLHPASPNPFNPATQIRYDLKAAQPVGLRIYDVRGRLVVTLIDGIQPAGQHQLVWQGTDEAGQAVASGVYYLRLQLADEEQTQRLSLVR